MQLDVTMTAGAIDHAADMTERAAADLRRLAARMRADGDLQSAGEAASVVAQLPGQCRLDLFVVRPLRECQRALATQE